MGVGGSALGGWAVIREGAGGGALSGKLWSGDRNEKLAIVDMTIQRITGVCERSSSGMSSAISSAAALQHRLPNRDHTLISRSMAITSLIIALSASRR